MRDKIYNMQKRNVYLKSYSQTLRKNMTEQERKLWYDFLKHLPVQFYRQRIIENFIVDFYCPSRKTVIELDGSQHYEGETEISDKIRDKRLNALGIDVLRYSNLEINENFDAVCQDIYNRLNLN